MKGRVSVKVGSEKMTFHFGLWVIERLELAFNAQLSEVYDTGRKDENDKPIFASKFFEAIGQNNHKFLANLLFWGRFFVYELEEKEVDFNIAQAYLWIDELGLESKEMLKIIETFNESVKSHLPEPKGDQKAKKK
tara:strand:+ start:900 stop:1304 length:405 start_codon:yes stop_codon:yes gene_type:complete